MQTYSSTFKYSQARKKSSLRLLLQERIGQRVASLEPSAPGDSIKAEPGKQRVHSAWSPLRTISALSPLPWLFLFGLYSTSIFPALENSKRKTGGKDNFCSGKKLCWEGGSEIKKW